MAKQEFSESYPSLVNAMEKQLPLAFCEALSGMNRDAAFSRLYRSLYEAVVKYCTAPIRFVLIAIHIANTVPEMNKESTRKTMNALLSTVIKQIVEVSISDGEYLWHR